MGTIAKRKWTLVAFILSLLLNPTIADAAFGPDEWHEYRLKDDKNAVYNQEGVEPLEAKTFKTADEVRATPVVAGDRLFVGNHNSGDLFAFDVNTGEELWRSKALNWVHSEMIYNDGTVFVGFGNRFFQEDGTRGTEESGVLALDAETGETKWKFNTPGEVMPTPAYKDGYVYAATGDDHLYKIHAETGKPDTKVNLGHTVSMSSPNIVNEQLFVGGSGPLPYAFTSVDLSKDEIKWQTDFENATAGLDDVPPAIDQEIVVTTALEEGTPARLKQVYDREGVTAVYKEAIKGFFGGGDFINERKNDPRHKIYAMDTETGEVLWEDSLGVGEFVKNNKSGAPIIYEGKVFVGSPITKKFYAYDLKTGERLWEFKNKVMKAPPVAADGVVYFSNAKGFVHAMDAETGEEIGRKKLGGKLAPSGPIIMNDTLIVGSQDSNVYALPTEDIRHASDEYSEASQEKSLAGYFTFVYGILLLLLAALVAALVFAIRKIKKVNKAT
ncbi:Outer membrane protein assembly factor BamB, contains PQQ-like beta-propeller repeat [Thalassobacillus cyri]|uniref:Outer membrane protein assembly factor BamB, contains PQQ-like beta-propeller repeat n=1 Tax=Thalassobacillus cyri TaxID=571932 RepID=A0A1H4DXA9_9BACI|nr:PQQ-binding-like beta-propeller repeat protein [Thalassobacillus cyri]SEA77217.1 Outer membrane protein assembly factor BamB, contains PQQ-like beta-propeller repeat [Thalassobacillus cyri]